MLETPDFGRVVSPNGSWQLWIKRKKKRLQPDLLRFEFGEMTCELQAWLAKKFEEKCVEVQTLQKARGASAAVDLSTKIDCTIVYYISNIELLQYIVVYQGY